MNQAAAPTTTASTATSAWYRDGIHVLPYTFGVRLPYPNPADGSLQQTYDAGYEQGAYDAAWRVGLGGLLAGLVTGALIATAVGWRRR